MAGSPARTRDDGPRSYPAAQAADGKRHPPLPPNAGKAGDFAREIVSDKLGRLFMDGAHARRTRGWSYFEGAVDDAVLRQHMGENGLAQVGPS